MKYALSLFSAATLVASCVTSLAQAQVSVTDAPIGLVWGSSSAEVQAKGIELNEIEGTDFGKTYSHRKWRRR